MCCRSSDRSSSPGSETSLPHPKDHYLIQKSVSLFESPLPCACVMPIARSDFLARVREFVTLSKSLFLCPQVRHPISESPLSYLRKSVIIYPKVRYLKSESPLHYIRKSMTLSVCIADRAIGVPRPDPEGGSDALPRTGHHPHQEGKTLSHTTY